MAYLGASETQIIVKLVDQASDGFRRIGQAAEQTDASFKKLVVGISGLATAGFNLYLNFDRIQKSQVQLDRSNLMVQRSTESLDQATKTYNETIQKYGILSPEAKDAADKLKIAQEALSVATDRAELAQGNLNNTIASFALSIAPTAITAMASGSGLIKTVKSLTAELELSRVAALGLSLGIASIAIAAGTILAPAARQAALSLREMLGYTGPFPGSPKLGELPSPLNEEQKKAATTGTTGVDLSDFTKLMQELNSTLTQTTGIVSTQAPWLEVWKDRWQATIERLHSVNVELKEMQDVNQTVFDNLIHHYNVDKARTMGEEFVDAYTKAWESGSMIRAISVAVRFANAMKIDLQDAVNILDELMNKIEAPEKVGGYDWQNLGGTGPVYGLGPGQIMPDWMVQPQTNLVTVRIEGPVVNIQGDASRATAAMAASMVQETLKNITLTASSSAADATHKQIQVNATVVTNAGGGAVVGGGGARKPIQYRHEFRE
jgi:hypothetical protein